ncbi:transcription-repair coupling factor [Adlercreutzia shanghongiae]|uniref:Transcription-repair-coupling factor n=1 Tax=Adlercreutzia shanghongiae TaxID=3111773 RepID=A0ABU6IZG8_9ACTN|nr:transcription-repair coupling factor [Adlercreutzia sp. R22]MEC4295247.1 transcription-repair coupling factor [Adlercreutzia sp. R22]
MLIDSLAFTLEKSGCLDAFWGKLDAGADATLGVAASARPFLVAARFAHAPQATLVVVAGEDAAVAFARQVAAFLGEERVLRFPERADVPFAPKKPDARVIARRMEAAWALQSGRPVVVVASARALLRLMAPPAVMAARPLSLSAGTELEDMGIPGVAELDDLPRSLATAGYADTGELDGPGTFAHRGGTLDVFPGNLDFPVRLDFFGDELEEIRRIVPATGQTISSLPAVEICPVSEFPTSPRALADARRALEKPALTNPALRDVLEKMEGGLTFEGADVILPYLYKQPMTLGAYAGAGTLTALIEPRSLFDDAAHAAEDLTERARGTNIALAGLYAAPAAMDFGGEARATYVSIMRVGGEIDDELPVKRVDVAGVPDKIFGKLKSLTTDRYTVVFSAPNYRARETMRHAFVDHGIPIQIVRPENLDNGNSAAAVGRGVPRADSADSETADFAVADATANEPTLRGFDASDKHPCAGLGVGQSQLGPAAGVSQTPQSPSLTLSDQRVDENDYEEKAAKRRLRRGVVNIVDNDIPLGMIIPKAHLALVSAADTQGSRAASRAARVSVDVTEVTFPFKPGDYVVHAAHGIAFFRDLVRREVDGTERDYLQLEYAEGDKLFVPVEQLDRVTRYVGPEGASPRLTRLNTSDWSRALAKARKATKKLAFDLVDVYARRAATQGFRFSPDTPWQREMEEAFPYQETRDQLAAIADVKADMESARPMDRLICGDVGFGKTEVALRAAFKATQDGKQVMVLCPTTILAQQHYTSFKDRFEPFGVTVEVLSRFRTSEQQARALEGFASGEVQVLVGTHRLLSRDVNPHDLGLVIIDEEQRFGVQHKEQLKNLRESIDVLTLSATPIPRTMQMSLSGVRDMSLILTPPDERRPVEVHVGEWDPDVVSAAIRYELARGGQVYYVSNRVRSIDEAVDRVHAAAGEARVGVAHGQMTKEELERVMEEFAAGELDVLVATTIIESGIDNPHTNTLIIEDAQRLGLAQMYQLKGRVGRSSVQAFAYFMFPENVPLTEEAAARLTAINEHQDLGSGMRIAMRDLEIRGAGSMLGAEQSGNMSAVGFDLFAQMLSQAVNDTREKGEATGELPPALSDITVNIPGHAYLPEEYIPDADARVLWYRKLAAAATVEAVAALREEMEAKAPKMPPAAANLFARAHLKAFANEHGIKLISVVAGRLVVEPIDVPDAKMKPLRRAGGRYNPDKRKLALPLRYFNLEEQDNLMGPIAGFLAELTGDDRAEEGEGETAERTAPGGAGAGVAGGPGAAAGDGEGATSGTASAATARTAAGKGARAGTATGGSATSVRAAGAASASPRGDASAGGSSPSAARGGKLTARGERRASNLAKGDAARDRLAAKRAARAAKRQGE